MATIPETLAIAIRHHQGGRLQAAQQIYRQILAVEPNHADAIHLLGVIAHQMGEHETAVEYIERAIGLKGSAPAFHNNLGGAYRALRRIPEAIACYRRALEVKPDYAEAHNNLGNAFKDQGKLDEAVACYRRALELKPDYAEAHNNLGVALKDQEKLDEAVACYHRALELKPDLVEAYNNLGLALKDRGEIDEAIACYRRALELKPDFAEAHGNLGNALQGPGEARRIARLLPPGTGTEAGPCRAPQQPGQRLAGDGRFPGRGRLLPRRLAAQFPLRPAHYKLAELLGGKLPENDLAAQRRLLEDTDLTDAQRLLLHFALAKVLDARGEYAEAARHLDQGNSLQGSEWRRRGRQYDPKEHESLVTRMIAVCMPDFFAGPRLRPGKRSAGVRRGAAAIRHHARRADIGQPLPGLRRGGDQIRPGHHERARRTRHGLHRGPWPVGPPDGPTAGFAALGETSRTESHSTSHRGQDAGQLLVSGSAGEPVSAAKLIHCRRDLRDVAVSCWMTHFGELPWANDQQHIASRFQEYQRLMEHWRKVLPVPLLEVDYEETVADLEGVARRLVAWCGLAWEPSCLEFHRAKRPVRTASAIQVRQPVFTTSVGRWQHYEQPLDWLLARLESMVQ